MGNPFTDAIEATIPDIKDVNSAYSKNSKASKIIDSTDKDNPSGIPFEALSYNFFHEVFVIFRPLNSCYRCTNDITNNKLTLP